jgi:hypothetical protein
VSSASFSSSSSATALLKETSVTPRQRPKAACQLNTINNQFTIGLPPSPSPRNVLSSPVHSKTPEHFNAQFDVHFNNNVDQPAPAPTISNQPINPPVLSQQLSSNTTQISMQQDNKEQFDTLFKSTFPDPFEHDDEIVQIQTNNYNGPLLTKSEQLFDIIPENQVSIKVNQHRRYMSDTSGFKRFENC